MAGNVHLFENQRPGGGELRSTSGLLSLLALPGVGPKRALQIASHYATRRALHNAELDELVKLVGKEVARTVQDSALETPAQPIAEDVWVIGFYDDQYPPQLRTIADPPALLWGRGAIPDSQTNVAVVGSRNATSWASDTTRRVVDSAVSAGFTIVSGLAVGVDSIAHRSCLACDGITIAVLANGVDDPYPAANRELAESIIEKGGTLVAEVPPGTRVNSRQLVARDRLQSALSLGTVVVQSGIPGGTLHTARFTIEQNRLLAVAVPYSDAGEGATRSDPYAGNLALISDSGIDPAILKAKGSLANRISLRRPAADATLRTSADLPRLWDRLRRRRDDEGEVHASGNGIEAEVQGGRV